MSEEKPQSNDNSQSQSQSQSKNKLGSTSDHQSLEDLTGFDIVPCGVLVTNGEGQIIKANAQMADLIGFSNDQLLSMELPDLVPPATKIFIQTYIWPTVLMDKTMREIFVKFKHAKGHTIPVLLNVSQFQHNDTQLFSWAIFAADERTKLETELRNARHNAEQDSVRLAAFSQELKRSNEAFADFTNIASHDLKAPLININRLSKILIEDYDDLSAAEHVKILDVLSRQVSRANNLIDGLLFYAKAGADHGGFESTSLKKLTGGIFEFVATGDDFTFQYIGEDVAMDTLHVPLALILRNLINNGIKHHDRSDGMITVRCTEESTHYVIDVEDDGAGIALENQENIFNIFDRLRHQNIDNGVGLGLSIVKKVVESYGGSISLTSTLGEGTCFHVKWPRNDMLKLVLESK